MFISAHNTDDTSMVKHMNRFTNFCFHIVFDWFLFSPKQAELLVKNNANVNEISKGEPLLSVAAKFGDFRFENKWLKDELSSFFCLLVCRPRWTCCIFDRAWGKCQCCGCKFKHTVAHGCGNKENKRCW